MLDAVLRASGSPGERGFGFRAGRRVYSGLLKCSTCGSNYIMVNARSYACASHHNGKACPNDALFRRDVFEVEWPASIKASLLTPAAIEEVRARVAKALAQRTKAQPDRGKEIAKLEREIANMVDAIAAGALSPTLAARLEMAERELGRLKAAASAPVTPAERMIPRLIDQYRELVDNRCMSR